MQAVPGTLPADLQHRGTGPGIDIYSKELILKGFLKINQEYNNYRGGGLGNWEELVRTPDRNRGMQNGKVYKVFRNLL